jgi:hypothetical protein
MASKKTAHPIKIPGGNMTKTEVIKALEDAGIQIEPSPIFMHWNTPATTHSNGIPAKSVIVKTHAVSDDEYATLCITPSKIQRYTLLVPLNHHRWTPSSQVLISTAEEILPAITRLMPDSWDAE